MLDHDKQMMAVDAMTHAAHMAQHAAYGYMSSVAEAMMRPSVLYRPALSIDGDQWCALYGNNLQEGVAGFGSSPEAAIDDFNANWVKSIRPKIEPQKAFDEMIGAHGFPSIRTPTGATHEQ